MIDIEKEIIKNIDCHCGKTHNSPVDKIIVEADIGAKIPNIIKNLLFCGHIALVSYSDIEVYSDIRHSLIKAGYKLSEINYEPLTRATEKNAEKILNIDESVRLIIGIGSGSLCEMVKYVSFLKKIPNVFIITSPSTDSWLIPHSYLDDEEGLKEFEGTPPSMLIADPDIKVPRALTAAGIANCYARLIGIFDYEYRSLVSGCEYCKSIINELKAEIKNFFNIPFDFSDKGDLRRLLNLNLNIALKLGYLGDNPPIMAENTLIRLIRLKKYNCPSAPLIAAYSLNNLYRNWLYDMSRELIIPPDRSYYYDVIKKLFNMDNIDTLQKVIGYDDELYSKVAYSTSNLRKELINELDNLVPDASSMAKNISKIFVDNGYHMTEIMDFDYLMAYISMSGELTKEFSLIKQIDKTGILWHYIEAI